MDELLDAVIDGLARDPLLMGLLAEAQRLTGDDLGASVDLVFLRLRQERPGDAPVLAALGRASAMLALAERLASAQPRGLLDEHGHRI